MSAHQQRDGDEIDEELDNLDEDVELDSFLDTMEDKNNRRDSKLTARRKIEDLLEEKRLSKLIDDSFDDED